MNIQRTPTVSVNGREYKFPKTPTVAVCIDGSEPGYIERAIDAGLAPNFARLMKIANLTALSAMPSFTNPNNMSIITGRPPAVHGIAGNYFYDRAAGKEVMMNDASFLRAPTIMKAFHDAGAKVAVVTAKDKLRAMLGKDLDMSTGRAIAFSSEKADQATVQANGIGDVLKRIGKPLPEVYSSDLSEFVMAAGVSILKKERPDLMYLSTTDYVQHKAAPGSEFANSFYAMMDRYVGELDAAGAVLVLTADHGMNDKHLPNGEPDVIYLQNLTDEWLGKGVARVLLPITDPVCGASRRARLLCDDLSARGHRRECAARQAARGRRRRAGDLREGSVRALRASGGPLRRRRGDLHHPQGARHRAREARSLGAHRAAALAWRAHRAGGADDREPRGDAARGAQAAQFRHLRCGAAIGGCG